jgi:AraC family transcriptional regulator of adaptative response / DNA-3-methyladenine glycosylase II
MADVAIASGFNSVRRFNETFRQMYGRPPAEMRHHQKSDRSDTSAITLALPYRPPYDWESMLGLLSMRAIPGVEHVEDQRYFRTIGIGDAIGMMEVENLSERASLRVTVTVPQIANLATIIARTRHLFDLSADPVAIDAALSQDPVLARLVKQRPGLRVPGAWDPFETAVRAVAGQQISVNAATKLAGRLAANLGSPVPAAWQRHQLLRTFPRPAAFRLDSAIAVGMPRKRTEAIVALAEAAERDSHLFDPKSDLDAAIDELRILPGARVDSTIHRHAHAPRK